MGFFDLFKRGNRVPEEVRQYRLDMCHMCPSLIKATGQCGECGCIVKLKTKLQDERCPLDKWVEYHPHKPWGDRLIVEDD